MSFPTTNALFTVGTFGKIMGTFFHSLKIAWTLAVGLCAVAQASEAADPFSGKAPASDVSLGNPSHLVPIPAYNSDGYGEAVYQSLVGHELAEGWMIVRPSFAPEYAVIVRHVVRYAKSSGPPDPSETKIESEKWVVEHVEARRKIWQWKELKGGRAELDIKVTKELNRRAADLSRDFAEKMVSAWKAVLMQTRYPETPNLGLDGVTYQFCYKSSLFGETWSPKEGIPRVITDLGKELGLLAKEADKDREAHLRKCLALAAKLDSGTVKSSR